jgi:hypothetical protein
LSREGSCSYHTCCDTRPQFFRSHSTDRPIQSLFTTHKAMWRIYSNPDPHRSPINRLLWHARGCWWHILSRILTGLFCIKCLSYNPFVVLKKGRVVPKILQFCLYVSLVIWVLFALFFYSKYPHCGFDTSRYWVLLEFSACIYIRDVHE